MRSHDTKTLEYLQSAERLNNKSKVTNEYIDNSREKLIELEKEFEKQKQEIEYYWRW
ncbi:hypothetical protein ACKLNO_01695 [Neisseriaceae bacterium B1]